MTAIYTPRREASGEPAPPKPPGLGEDKGLRWLLGRPELTRTGTSLSCCSRPEGSELSACGGSSLSLSPEDPAPWFQILCPQGSLTSTAPPHRSGLSTAPAKPLPTSKRHTHQRSQNSALRARRPSPQPNMCSAGPAHPSLPRRSSQLPHMDIWAGPLFVGGAVPGTAVLHPEDEKGTPKL